MRPGLRRVIAWLTIYELTYFTTIVASSLLSVSGAPFQGFEGSAGKSSALIGVVTTWLNDVAILLTVATLVVIHPLLGVPAIALYSTSSSRVFASWFAGSCNARYLAYALIESQTLIALWLSAVGIHYAQRRGGLLEKWRTTLRLATRFMLYSTTILLALAVAKVFWVDIHG